MIHHPDMNSKKIFLLLAGIFAIGIFSFNLIRRETSSTAGFPTLAAPLQLQSHRLDVEIAHGQGEPGAEAPSILKLKDGRHISDVGFGVELIKQEVISGNRHIFLLKSRPCTECDIPAELLIYFVESQKKHGVIFPGKFTNSESEQIDDIALGFIGKCGGPDFHVWIFHKWLDPDHSETWLAEKISVNFTSNDIFEDKSPLAINEFDAKVAEFEQAQSCQKLPELDQSYR